MNSGYSAKLLKAKGIYCIECTKINKKTASQIKEIIYDYRTIHPGATICVITKNTESIDEDGYEIVRKLRNNQHTSRVPVIMVSAKSTEIDMVKGLDDGADDYIKKPFSVMELLSRVKALLRRTQKEEVHSMSVGNVTVDIDKHLVTSCGETVELTFKEFQLLRYLMINEGVVLSRESIMQQVWDTDFEGETRTVDMHIKTLRQKLGEGSSIIKTIRNVGYVIQSEE